MPAASGIAAPATVAGCMSAPPYTSRQYRKAVGDILKQLRTEAGMTQEKVAAEVGCDRTHLSDLENGYHEPRIYLVAKLAACYGLTQIELVSRIEERALWRAARSRPKPPSET
jgi:transcriptional regulator with XRE-family HTH domain